jgi:hypothetical protein
VNLGIRLGAEVLVVLAPVLDAAGSAVAAVAVQGADDAPA